MHSLPGRQWQISRHRDDEAMREIEWHMGFRGPFQFPILAQLGPAKQLHPSDLYKPAEIREIRNLMGQEASYFLNNALFIQEVPLKEAALIKK
jgi:hypothetical protein